MRLPDNSSATRWHTVLSLLSLLGPAASQGVPPTEDCPILGPAYPSSFDIASTKAFQDAVKSFPQRLDELFEDGTFNRSSSSLSIDVFSAYTNETIFSYYHAAPALNETLNRGVLNDGTIQRIGSVSKLFTVYTLLAKGGIEILQEPVTKYVPELAGNPANDTLNKIHFEGVTLEALASHQSGTGGFSTEHSTCLNNTSPSYCTVEGYLANVRELPPVAPVFGTSLYSDQAYGILSRVVERLTGFSYDEAIKSILAEPLDMTSTSAVMPEDEDVNAFIYPGVAGVDTAWGHDNLLIVGSGGVYASFADLRKLGLSILHSELLDSTTTRAWMKPHGFVAPLTVGLGAPWEINRLPLAVSPGSNRTRISDLYTKGGGQPSTGTIFALSPDHGIGYSVISNTDDPVRALEERWPLRQLVGDVFITAAEHAAHENAANNLAGVFVSPEDSGTNITITVDDDRPGLGISSMYINGTESRGNIAAIPSETEIPAERLSVRMYPMGLETVDGSGAQHVAFRAIPLTLPPARTRASAEGGTSLFENQCLNFLNVGFTKGADRVHGVDEFILEIADGRLQSVSYRASGITMQRERDQQT